MTVLPHYRYNAFKNFIQGDVNDIREKRYMTNTKRYSWSDMYGIHMWFGGKSKSPTNINTIKMAYQKATL